jgi:hypothetical protein
MQPNKKNQIEVFSGSLVCTERGNSNSTTRRANGEVEGTPTSSREYSVSRQQCAICAQLTPNPTYNQARILEFGWKWEMGQESE